MEWDEEVELVTELHEKEVSLRIEEPWTRRSVVRGQREADGPGTHGWVRAPGQPGALCSCLGGLTPAPWLKVPSPLCTACKATQGAPAQHPGLSTSARGPQVAPAPPAGCPSHIHTCSRARTTELLVTPSPLRSSLPPKSVSATRLRPAPWAPHGTPS